MVSAPSRLLLLGCGLLAACALYPMPPAARMAPRIVLPLVIHECETNTATVCGTWTFDDEHEHYRARWTQGSRARIVVLRFDGDSVRFSRYDDGGTSMGMRAEYRGAVKGNGVPHGVVTWTEHGSTWSGRWNATW